MGKKKFRNPFQIGNRSKTEARIMMASDLALTEYNARKEARRIMGVDKEVIARDEEQNSAREIWMWGLFAVVLHRRYKFTAKKISEILVDIQNIHNELSEQAQDSEDEKRLIFKVVKEEVGLSIFDDDIGDMKEWE